MYTLYCTHFTRYIWNVIIFFRFNSEYSTLLSFCTGAMFASKEYSSNLPRTMCRMEENDLNVLFYKSWNYFSLLKLCPNVFGIPITDNNSSSKPYWKNVYLHKCFKTIRYKYVIVWYIYLCKPRKQNKIIIYSDYYGPRHTL